jgi:hypothetical protein
LKGARVNSENDGSVLSVTLCLSHAATHLKSFEWCPEHHHWGGAAMTDIFACPQVAVFSSRFDIKNDCFGPLSQNDWVWTWRKLT